jgi:hypothetical protein
MPTRFELDDAQYLEFGKIGVDVAVVTVDDPYERVDIPEPRPTFGLDDGETDGILLANVLDMAAF